VAVADDAGRMIPAIKVSEDAAKVPIPGEKRLFRVYDRRGLATADVIALADEELTTAEALRLHHPHRGLQRIVDRGEISEIEELLIPVFRDGRRLDGEPELDELRRRRSRDLERLDPGVRRLVNPHVYHVSVTGAVHDLQQKLVAEALGGAEL
jgi:nicotinate phosphoribosyltransferase